MSVGAVDKQTGYRIPTAGMPAVDAVLSGTSTNPVQNKVVKEALDNKQDTLTFDSVPTDGSNNPVKSNGIYDSEKDIYAAMGEMGAKNLISYPWYDTTKSVNGVTFTANTDGTISVVTDANGATANTVFNLHTRGSGESNDLVVKNGNYILTGCPSGGINEKYRLTINVSKNGSAVDIAKDFGNGVSVTLDGDDYSQTHTNIGVFIFVTAGTTITTPITFKPMLRLASDTDGTYQPYAKTNKQLTDDVASLNTALATKADTDMVAADFNAGTSYTAGNYCVYGGKFYKFNTNHSGAWAAADVDEIKIAGELSSLNSKLISNYTTAGGMHLYKFGCVVFAVIGDGDFDTDASSNIIGMTIPEAYRPIGNTSILEAYAGKRININSNGTVTIYNTPSTSDVIIRFGMTWLTN